MFLFFFQNVSPKKNFFPVFNKMQWNDQGNRSSVGRSTYPWVTCCQLSSINFINICAKAKKYLKINIIDIDLNILLLLSLILILIYFFNLAHTFMQWLEDNWQILSLYHKPQITTNLLMIITYIAAFYQWILYMTIY